MDLLTTTAAIYAEFAARETHGVSPTYERLSVAVSRDDEMLAPARRAPASQAAAEPLIWTEHAHRRARLQAAAAVAAADPPLLVRGDLVDDLPALAVQAPADATLVVFHMSVMYQVPPRRREAFAAMVRRLPGHWIADEDPDVLTYDTLPTPPDREMRDVLALDGMPLAWTWPHGQAIIWFG